MIESVLSRLSVGTVDLTSESRATAKSVLSASAEVSAAMEGLTNEAVDIMLLVYLGDIHAGKRLHPFLMSHIEEVAKEERWDEFKTGTGMSCWEMLSISSVGELLHGKKKVNSKHGFVETDSDGEPITVDFRYSDRKLASIMMINKDTSARKKVPLMHRFIVSWLEGMGRAAGDSILRKMKA